MAELSQKQINALDTIRSHLTLLRSNFDTLNQQIQDPNTPLPAWPTLQKQTSVLLQSLETLVVQTRENDDLLNNAVVFPTTTFPTATADHVLQSLLRSKFEPGVDEWVEESERAAKKVDDHGVLGGEDRAELWAGAMEVFSELGRKQIWGADYTAQEVEDGVEKVDAGLRRKLEVPIDPDDEDFEEDEEGEEDMGDEDGEDQEGEMDLDQPAEKKLPPVALHKEQMPLNDVLKFMTTGQG